MIQKPVLQEISINTNTSQKETQIIESLIFKSLASSITDLNCSKHEKIISSICCNHQCAEFICSNCKHECQHISKKENETPVILEINQFIENPVMAYIPVEEKQLSQMIGQSNILFKKIKLQTDNQKQQLSQYLNNLVNWVINESKNIQKKFDQLQDQILDNIRKIIDDTQQITNIFKDEFENLLTSKKIGSKNEFKQICQIFLQSSDNPTHQLKQHFINLQKCLASLPDINIKNQKNLYNRVCDQFRFCFDSLINSKQSEFQFQNSSEFVNKLNFKLKIDAKNVNKIVEINDQNFITVEDNKIKFWKFNDKKEINSLTKSKKINDIICLKNLKYIVYGSQNGLELLHLQSGQIIYQDSISSQSLIEISGQNFISGDEKGILHFYSFENVKNICKISEIQTPLELITCLTYKIYNQNTNGIDNFIDKEMLACAGSSNQILIIDIYNFKIIKNISFKTKFGFNQIEFTKKNLLCLTRCGYMLQYNLEFELLQNINCNFKGIAQFCHFQNSQKIIVACNGIRLISLEKGNIVDNMDTIYQNEDNENRIIQQYSCIKIFDKRFYISNDYETQIYQFKC